MKKVITILVLMAFSSAAFATTTGRGGLFFGSKKLNHKDWGDFDSQPAWGINLDVKDTSWPVWATAGYIRSRDQEKVVTSVSPFATTEIEAKTSEFRIGVKKDFRPVPLVGLSFSGGPAYITASLDSGAAPFNRDSDGNVGFWCGTEVTLLLKVLTVGVAYQYSYAKVNLFGNSVNAGGSGIALLLGVGW